MKKLLIIFFLALMPLYAAAEETQPAQDVVATPSPPPPATRQWEMIPEDSSITFRGKQMGKNFDGKIAKFTAQIWFDPAQLDQSKVIAEMDLRFIDANDDERNKNLMGKDWLDVIEFPTARFETLGLRKTGDNSYVADATLTIHGVIQELEFPFMLSFEENKDSGKEKAVMTGSITLDRSKFLLGQGDWADPSVIANEIPVEVKVTATSPKP